MGENIGKRRGPPKRPDTHRKRAPDGRGTAVVSLDTSIRTRGITDRLSIKEKASKESPCTAYHVLVIDDDLDILLFVRKTLQEAGYSVEVAESSMEGISRFRRREPDLVLLDVNLPGENGFETCARLKQLRSEDFARQVRTEIDPEISKVPIVFLTAHGKPEDVREAVRVGGDGYIVKPFTPDVLLDKVKTFLKIS